VLVAEADLVHLLYRRCDGDVLIYLRVVFSDGVLRFPARCRRNGFSYVGVVCDSVDGHE